MTPRGKKILIRGSLLATGTAIGIFTFIKIRNNMLRAKLDAILTGGTGQYGDLKDIPGFKGKSYRDGLSPSLNIIKLKDEVARDYADKIDKAWGFTNDDEDKIYQIFREIKDNYALSQVASVYEVIYKVALLNKLEDKLNEDEQNEIYKIARLYKPYRTAS